LVNAGVRFMTVVSKMCGLVDVWDEITRDGYGVENP